MSSDEIPDMPSEMSDTRDEGYCWKVVDEDGEDITYLTMDWSAHLYEDGMPESEEIRIISWEVK